jgi:hypothetical protein
MLGKAFVEDPAEQLRAKKNRLFLGCRRHFLPQKSKGYPWIMGPERENSGIPRDMDLSLSLQEPRLAA